MEKIKLQHFNDFYCIFHLLFSKIWSIFDKNHKGAVNQHFHFFFFLKEEVLVPQVIIQ